MLGFLGRVKTRPCVLWLRPTYLFPFWLGASCLEAPGPLSWNSFAIKNDSEDSTLPTDIWEGRALEGVSSIN